MNISKQIHTRIVRACLLVVLFSIQSSCSTSHESSSAKPSADSSSTTSSDHSSSTSSSSDSTQTSNASSESKSSEASSLISTNKKEYLRNEDVFIKASGEESDWVGIYRLDDDVNSVESIRWFYVNKNGFQPDVYYSVKKSLAYNDSRKSLRNLPNFKYKAVLFSSDSMEKQQYSEFVKEICYFEVLSESISKPNAPKTVTYTLSDPSSGLSNGTIELHFDDIPVTSVTMFWGDESGALPEYTALRRENVYSNPYVFALSDDSIIPAKASKLLIYSANSAGTSDDYYSVSLPNESQRDPLAFTNEFTSEFEVVSDIHIAIKATHLASEDAQTLHTEHLNDFLLDLKNINGDKKTPTIVVGDIANSGAKEEWESADSALRSQDSIGSVYYSLGNHDLYGGSYSQQIEYFYEYAKKDYVYYKIDIDGYTHLFLGSENSDSSVDAWLSKEQLNWLEQTMDEETSKNQTKPVFVYMHQSLYNTVSGSLPGQGWNGVTQDEDLRRIISKYKQIILFNGHSHWTMNSPKNHYKASSESAHIFNTASVAYLWDSSNIPTGEYLRGSQGYYLKLLKSSVYVLGRDYELNKFIPSACYRIDF